MWDDVGKVLAPHSERLNQTLNLQGALLHQRLASIEAHVSDLARPDVGDTWRDLGFNGLTGGVFQPKDLEQVPMNEIWMVQAASVLGAAAVAKVVVRANKKLRIVMPVSATLPTTFGAGGNVVFLPGEVITVEGEAEGQAEISITVIRRKLPVTKMPAQMGKSGDVLGSQNTHDPARDVITSRTGGYTEVAPEVQNQDGLPSLIDPTSV